MSDAPASARSWSQTALQMMRILAAPGRSRSDLVYDLLREGDLWSIDSNYLNLGYWPGVDNIDDASRQLATLVASRADINGPQLVLDAGCGFGDQCALWADQYPQASFCAISNSGEQLKHALTMVERRGLGKRISIVHCTATHCPFPPQCFDRIVALESAFHFDTREQFFHHALELLKPGGRIVLADFIARSSVGLAHRLAREIGGAAWQIPRSNLCSRKVYRDQLQAAGFSDVELQDVTGEVIEPFARFIRERYQQPDYRATAHPLVRASARVMTGAGFLESLDYVIVSARRPLNA